MSEGPRVIVERRIEDRWFGSYGVRTVIASKDKLNFDVLTTAISSRPPPAAVRPVYSNFDWLGLVFGRQQYQPTPLPTARLSSTLPTSRLFF
jgi:hypothetical protein